jgi:hypothetical protein
VNIAGGTDCAGGIDCASAPPAEPTSNAVENNTERRARNELIIECGPRELLSGHF